MENERTENIFYLDLKPVHKYGCAKFQPNTLFSSQQTATKSAAEEKKKEQKKKWKKKKKFGKPIGDPVMGQDAPNMKVTHEHWPLLDLMLWRLGAQMYRIRILPIKVAQHQIK